MAESVLLGEFFGHAERQLADFARQNQHPRDPRFLVQFNNHRDAYIQVKHPQYWEHTSKVRAQRRARQLRLLNQPLRHDLHLPHAELLPLQQPVQPLLPIGQPLPQFVLEPAQPVDPIPDLPAPPAAVPTPQQIIVPPPQLPQAQPAPPNSPQPGQLAPPPLGPQEIQAIFWLINIPGLFPESVSLN